MAFRSEMVRRMKNVRRPPAAMKQPPMSPNLLRNAARWPQQRFHRARARQTVPNCLQLKILIIDVALGPAPDVYAYSRETVQRNLYRIPIP